MKHFKINAKNCDGRVTTIFNDRIKFSAWIGGERADLFFFSPGDIRTKEGEAVTITASDRKNFRLWVAGSFFKAVVMTAQENLKNGFSVIKEYSDTARPYRDFSGKPKIFERL